MKRDDPEAPLPFLKKYYLVGTASKTSESRNSTVLYLVLKTLFTLTNQPEMKFTSKMTYDYLWMQKVNTSY